MTYCFHCGNLTMGKPLFCNRCGRSFDVRLCPRLHPNPRHAEVCSQCGSSELSTPQPKVSIWWRVLAFLIRVLIGTFLTVLSILVLLYDSLIWTKSGTSWLPVSDANGNAIWGWKDNQALGSTKYNHTNVLCDTVPPTSSPHYFGYRYVDGR